MIDFEFYGDRISGARTVLVTPSRPSPHHAIGGRDGMADRHSIEGAEEWRLVERFPAYEVSNLGRVRRIKPAMGASVGVVLRPSNLRGTYQQLILRRDGRSFSARVHALVAEAFIGPRPNGHEVHHKDFNPANNAPSNLEYVTHAENNRISARAGRIQLQSHLLRRRGEPGIPRKLTAEKVVAIRKRLENGERHTVIATSVGVSVSTICGIRSRKIWAHVP